MFSGGPAEQDSCEVALQNQGDQKRLLVATSGVAPSILTLALRAAAFGVIPDEPPTAVLPADVAPAAVTYTKQPFRTATNQSLA